MIPVPPFTVRFTKPSPIRKPAHYVCFSKKRPTAAMGSWSCERNLNRTRTASLPDDVLS
jgi:hypothetical protein